MQSQYAMFIERLKHEVLRDVSFNFQEQIMLHLVADLFGETWIQLSLSGNPPIDFVTPSFADSLFLPVIATNKEHFYDLAHDIDSLVMGTIENAVTPSFSDQLIRI